MEWSVSVCVCSEGCCGINWGGWSGALSLKRWHMSKDLKDQREGTVQISGIREF